MQRKYTNVIPNGVVNANALKLRKNIVDYNVYLFFKIVCFTRVLLCYYYNSYTYFRRIKFLNLFDFNNSVML